MQHCATNAYIEKACCNDHDKSKYIFNEPKIRLSASLPSPGCATLFQLVPSSKAKALRASLSSRTSWVTSKIRFKKWQLFFYICYHSVSSTQMAWHIRVGPGTGNEPGKALMPFPCNVWKRWDLNPRPFEPSSSSRSLYSLLRLFATSRSCWLRRRTQNDYPCLTIFRLAKFRKRSISLCST